MSTELEQFDALGLADLVTRKEVKWVYVEP